MTRRDDDVEIPSPFGERSVTDEYKVTTTPPRRATERLMLLFGLVLATVAAAALVVSALALRDSANQQRTQTKCEQSVAYSAFISALRSGATDWRVVPKATVKYMNQQFDRCTP